MYYLILLKQQYDIICHFANVHYCTHASKKVICVKKLSIKRNFVVNVGDFSYKAIKVFADF